jgi:hypothetical protein
VRGAWTGKKSAANGNVPASARPANEKVPSSLPTTNENLPPARPTNENLPHSRRPASRTEKDQACDNNDNDKNTTSAVIKQNSNSDNPMKMNNATVPSPLPTADDVTIDSDDVTGNDVKGACSVSDDVIAAAGHDVIEDCCASSSYSTSSGGNHSRNIFEENICSKDDIYSDTSSLSSASFLAERRGGGGVVVFDTKTCCLDQNANFITEVILSVSVADPVRLLYRIRIFSIPDPGSKRLPDPHPVSRI